VAAGRGKERRRATYEDDLEEHLLVDLHELLIPLINLGRLLAVVVLLLGGLSRIIAVLLAPLDDFLEHRFVDVGDGDSLFGHTAIADVLNQVLDQDGSFSDAAV